MAQHATIPDPADKINLAPYLSMMRPTNGDITTAVIPPRLTAAEKNPRDHPKCSVMGTMNIDNTATDIRGLEHSAIPQQITTTTHP